MFFLEIFFLWPRKEGKGKIAEKSKTIDDDGWDGYDGLCGTLLAPDCV